MKKLLLLSLCITLFAGCKKEEPYPKTDYFYGKWNMSVFNMQLEFLDTGVVKVVRTIYPETNNFNVTIKATATGVWSYDENGKNLKITINNTTWANAGNYIQSFLLSPFDSIIDRVEQNSFYFTLSGGTTKIERLP